MQFAILISISLLYFMYRQQRTTGHVIDVALAGLVCGVLLARVIHITLNWVYFQSHTDEITQLSGLDWHGAVIGALLGMWLVCRWRGVTFRLLLPALALILPFIGFVAWQGCAETYCSYGAEVDNLSNYPAWLVWEARDIYNIIVPRYATQNIGMMFCALLGVGYIFRSISFWWMLLIFSAGMFAIGFLRGDYAPMIAGLRADQWLDLLLLIGAAVLQWADYRRSTVGDALYGRS